MSRPVGSEKSRRGRLPVQSRDRRPALAALALLLVVAGGLGAGLVVYRSGQKTDVLVAAHEIKPGQQVTSGDFTTARASIDSGSVVAASNRGNFVGSYAVSDIPGGTLVSAQMFQATDLAPPGSVTLGVNVSDQLRPAGGLSVGDIVRAYYVPKNYQGVQPPPPGQTLANAVRVTRTEAGTSGGNSIYSLLVTPDEAVALMIATGTGQVGLGLLPPGTTPDVQYRKA